MTATDGLLDNPETPALSIDPMSLIQRIDALLPQTQCGKCGHQGCMPYAQGIAAGEPINRCPPGGAETIAALAQLLRTPVLPLDTSRGAAPAQVAYIREAECIGCTKCIQACPVDAILGAAKLMHTVLVDECTGCDLCVAPCPVDCIDLVPLASVPRPMVSLIGGQAASAEQRQARSEKRDQARQRFEQRNARLLREAQRRQTARLARTATAPPVTGGTSPAITTTGTQAPAAGAPRIAATAASAPASAPASATLSPIERIKAQKALAQNAALKQAKAAVAMSRAQVNKTRQAYDSPPTALQFARLQALHDELDAAQARLQLLEPSAHSTAQDPCHP